jgi:hypothetical protein
MKMLGKWFGQFNSNIKRICFRSLFIGALEEGIQRLGYFDIDVIKFTTKVKVPKWVGIKFII